jgi:hypothetical protein
MLFAGGEPVEPAARLNHTPEVLAHLESEHRPSTGLAGAILERHRPMLV